jgi:hypothetical protein
MTVRCWVLAFQCPGRSRGRRRPSLGAWVSSDSDHAPIFPQSDSKRLATEPLAHSSAPYPRAFDASARQSSWALLPPSSTPFDEPMPSEFSHELHGHKIPAERTPCAPATSNQPTTDPLTTPTALRPSPSRLRPHRLRRPPQSLSLGR